MAIGFRGCTFGGALLLQARHCKAQYQVLGGNAPYLNIQRAATGLVIIESPFIVIVREKAVKGFLAMVL